MEFWVDPGDLYLGSSAGDRVLVFQHRSFYPCYMVTLKGHVTKDKSVFVSSTATKSRNVNSPAPAHFTNQAA